jgi:GAF domain-containing protein
VELTQLLGVEPSPRDSEVPVLALAAGTPFTQDLLDTALDVVVTMAQAVVAGSDGASITLPRQGTLSTVAASTDVVREMDTDQYESGEGPCVDAAIQGERFHITSLDDETRWPEFVPRARARGIRSIMSTPLMNDGAALGALNIYSRTVDAFAAHEQQWADTFAAGAASVVVRASRALVVQDLEADLRQALESREVIALAQGITIARVGGTAAQAHRVLRDVSLRTGESLLEVCTKVVTGSTSRAPSGGGDCAPHVE